jgi:hypothetical protein
VEISGVFFGEEFTCFLVALLARLCIMDVGLSRLYFGSFSI